MIHAVFVLDFINCHNLQRETILQNPYVNEGEVILLEKFIFLFISKLKLK